VAHEDIDVTQVASGADAIAAIGTREFQCVLVGPEPSDMDTREFLEKLGAVAEPARFPVLVYTAQQADPLPPSEARELAESLLVKCVATPEDAIQQVAIHLHRKLHDLPEAQRNVLSQIRTTNPSLGGRKILIVDDDVRNIFALTSLLERYGMDVLRADDGRSALNLLKEEPGVELVLLDIMMPGMDGYETARAIRKTSRYRHVPIVALTAKAMKGDREKCIEAGASDYIPKPVDLDQLLSVLRVWLPPRQRASARSGGGGA
jgi:CheY-like chemotaxis protein